MANSSLDESCPTINLSLQQYDALIASTTKADALVQVALSADLEELSPHTLHHFLWALHDVMLEASRLCDSLHFPQASLAASPSLAGGQ